MDIISFFTDASPKNKGISFLYQTINHNLFSNKTPSRELWEAERSQQFNTQQWWKTSQLLTTFSKCTTHWESSLKILHRWYYYPTKLAKIFSSQSLLCWRECRNHRSLLHIWWECPVIKPFLNYAFNFLSSVSAVHMEGNPATSLLLLHHKSWAPTQTPFLVHGIIAARGTIAAAWKWTEPPDRSLFLQNLNTSTQFELLFAVKNYKRAPFWKHWHKCFLLEALA